MYAFIEGIVESIDEQNVVIVANGVGYEITCANPLHFEEHKKVRIYTYFYVREDQQLLFGFKEKEDKQLFAKLLNVSGIGPKSALSILGSSSASEIALAIEEENEKFLTSFPGVGKKTARQMILDLKGNVTEWMDYSKAKANEIRNTQNQQNKQLIEETLEALKSLGYSEREIHRIEPELIKFDFHSVDDYIRKGLSLMMEKK
jgi:holliday junction DNA helicase RuvA